MLYLIELTKLGV